jgi:hypothetical protein
VEIPEGMIIECISVLVAIRLGTSFASNSHGCLVVYDGDGSVGVNHA